AHCVGRATGWPRLLGGPTHTAMVEAANWPRRLGCPMRRHWPRLLGWPMTWCCATARCCAIERSCAFERSWHPRRAWPGQTSGMLGGDVAQHRRQVFGLVGSVLEELVQVVPAHRGNQLRHFGDAVVERRRGLGEQIVAFVFEPMNLLQRLVER